MKTLSKFYNNLPIIRELKILNHYILGLNKKLQLTEEACQKALSDLDSIKKVVKTICLNSLPENTTDYFNQKKLLGCGSQYWSQNLEDGMIAEIFRRIGTGKKDFVEIGVQDGLETNTSLLVALGWQGWWIEGQEKFVNEIKEKIEKNGISKNLKIIQAMVSSKNINEIFQRAQIPEEVDLFSLDIDLDTYHVWGALKNFRPKLVVVEYNAGFPPDQIWVNPSRPNKYWDGSMEYGASLKAFEILGVKLGYSLVGCDLMGVNAFFVRNDLLGDKFEKPYTSEKHYQPARYHLCNRNAHESFFPYPSSSTL